MNRFDIKCAQNADGDSKIEPLKMLCLRYFEPKLRQKKGRGAFLNKKALGIYFEWILQKICTKCTKESHKRLCV